MNVWGLLAAVALGALPAVVSADSSMLVRAGQEIAVRLPPMSSSAIEAAALGGSMQPAFAGASGSASLDGASPDGALLVLSSSAAPAVQSTLPTAAPHQLIPAAPDIVARCREIRHRFPGALCEPNFVYFADRLPNDPRADAEFSIGSMRLETAWNTTVGSRSVLVGVIDTGVDYTHPDLAANIALNEAEIPSNGRDDDGNGFIDDYVGFNAVDDNGDPFDENEHGTHVAGTIGAVGNNGIGVTGINWNVGLVPIRVLDASGAGSIAEIVRGIEYAVARRVRVINLSLGGADYSAIFEQAMNLAKDANILIVAAAGNEASNNDFFETFPASFKGSNIISVAAVDSGDRLAYFSNVGAASVDLGAPGVNIMSTIPGNAYDAFDGTSMATPHVAGLAALLLSINPRFTYRDLRTLILSTVRPASDLSGLTVTGGTANAAAAVSRARSSAASTLAINFKVRLRYLSRTLVADVTDLDGGRAGIPVSFQCGKAKKVTVSTKRSGRAAVKITRFNVRRPTTCRASARTSKLAVRSRALKVS